MRFLAWHVDHFKAVPTEKGRSPLVEEASVVESNNALLVFANFEKSDELRQADIVARAASEMSSIAKNLKIVNVVLNPFAHLFADPSSPESAVLMLHSLEDTLRAKDLQVQRLAFGMFYELDIKAKGHRYSRVARRIE